MINLAVILIENIKRYIGVHADTKPTSSVPVGSTFFETDTKNIYVFDGTNWGVGNPTFQTGDTITISSIEGKDAEAAAVTGKPLTVGYKDASGKATGVTPVNRLPVVAELSGSKVAEQLTNSEAVANVLTFSANISSVEIWHNEATPQVFIVNGLSLSIASGGWRSPIAGTPSTEITIPAGVTCSVARLV